MKHTIMAIGVAVGLVMVPTVAQETSDTDRIAAVEGQLKSITAKLDQLAAAMPKPVTPSTEEQRKTRMAAMTTALNDIRSQCPKGSDPVVLLQQTATPSTAAPMLLYGCVSR